MAERPLRFERRMSDAEALMWTIEKDPALRSAFLQLTLLDSPPDFARFRRRMERAVKVLPRLGQGKGPRGPLPDDPGGPVVLHPFWKALDWEPTPRTRGCGRKAAH